MKIKQLSISLLLLLFCSLAFAKDGYKITLKYESAERGAILYLEGWEKRIAIDSLPSNKKGIFKFTGKQNLAPGEYTIQCADKSIEFLVSESGWTEESFTIDGNSDTTLSAKSNNKPYPREITQKKGNRENALFTSFQNLVNYQWREIGNPQQVERRIEEITSEVKESCPNSLFATMLEGYSKSPNYKEIFSDPRIVSTRFGKKFIKDYFESIEYNHTDSVIAGVERVIEAAPETLQPYLAAEAFKYFEKPSIMGQESVAFHIAENYFSNNKLTPPYKGLDFEIRTFTMLNGKSLIGMDAQELVMQDTSASATSLRELISQGEFTILYFYTDDCITCRIETPKLVEFVNSYNMGVLNVYAVYTQDYTDRWKSYINSNFNIYNPFVNWVNAADPEFESGFHLLYNVISTPQIYLINNQGVIIGRDLSVSSMAQLIEKLKENQQMLHTFFNSFFGGNKSIEEVNGAIDRFLLGSSNNKEFLKEAIPELYIFLKFSTDHLLKEGALHLAKNYILGRDDLWSKEYLLRISDEVKEMSKNTPGSVAAQISFDDIEGGVYSLKGLEGEYKVVSLYNSGCNSCLPDVERYNEIEQKNRDKNITFIAADICRSRENWRDFITKNKMNWVNLWVATENLHSFFYLHTLPAIYLLDKENRVIARNLTPEALEKIVENL